MNRIPAMVVLLGMSIGVAACGTAAGPPARALQDAAPPTGTETVGVAPQEDATKVKEEMKEERKEETKKAVEEEIKAEVEAEEEEPAAPKEEAAPEPYGDRQVQAILSIDPCKFASPEQLKTLIQKPLIDLFPKKYKKYNISAPKSVKVQCPNMKLLIATDIKRKIKLLPDLKGKIAIESPITAKVTTADAAGKQVQKARACMGQIKLTKLDFKFVPSFLEKGMRILVNKGLNTILPDKVCGDVTPLVTSFVSKGGKL